MYTHKALNNKAESLLKITELEIRLVCMETRELALSLRAVKAGPLVLCYPKMSQNGIRKAAAEDREHGVAQKPPINNVENRLYIIIIINKRYHGNMYDNIIVGGQSLTALTIIFVDMVRNCAQVPTKWTPTETAQHEEA